MARSNSADILFVNCTSTSAVKIFSRIFDSITWERSSTPPDDVFAPGELENIVENKAPAFRFAWPTAGCDFFVLNADFSFLATFMYAGRGFPVHDK